MIDIQYFSRWPEELRQHTAKLDQFMEWVAESQHGFTPRDPRLGLRFQTAGKMCERIEANDPNESERRLAYQWRLLSNVVGHASPERHLINLKFPDFRINAIDQTVLTASTACHQLYAAVPEIRELIDGDDSLAERFQNLRGESIGLRVAYSDGQDRT